MKHIKSYIPHIIFLSILLVFIIIGASRLIAWNRGDNELPGVENMDDYELQPHDILAFMNSDYYEDDGELNILILGDESVCGYNDNSGLAAQIEKYTGGNVYDCSLPGTSITTTVPSFSTENPIDVLSLPWIVNGIASRDFTAHRKALDTLSYDDPIFTKTYFNLLSIDFDTIDIIIINYAPTYYLNNQPYIDDANHYNPNTYFGALNVSLANIKMYLPHVQVITTSPIYFATTDESGNVIESDVPNEKYGRLVNYLDSMIVASLENETCYLDNYYGLPFNVNNYEHYITDEIYPNAIAREMIAVRIADMIKQINPLFYGESD